jgi:hypothetical protein
VRAQSDHRYCVWDRELNRVAISPEKRECTDLTLEDAFKLVDDLLGPAKRS